MAANIAVGDVFETIETTMGFLSRGISYATTVYGGTGNDTFSVYNNIAKLRLEGGDGNDEFVVRAFIMLNSFDPEQQLTEVDGGIGDDYIQYSIKSPISINGGAGYDRVVALGTEANDVFVVTSYGIFGAGINITLDGVEEALEVDGLEGDDTIFVLSTSASMVTTIIGGLGNDTVNVAGDVTGTVISAELEGRSGVINHSVTSDDLAYNGLLVDGIALNVADAATGAVVITESAGGTVVDEDVAGSVDTYAVSLATASLAAVAPGDVAYITVSAASRSRKRAPSGRTRSSSPPTASTSTTQSSSPSTARTGRTARRYG